MMMRTAILAVILALAASSSPGLARPIEITVANRPIAAQAIEVQHHVLLPLRETFESLNSTVSYDARTRSVTARNILHVLHLRVGSRVALLDGRHVMLDVAPNSIDGRVY